MTPQPQQYLQKWKKQWDFTETEMAEVLDMGKAQINRYLNGRSPVPKTVLMACNWYSYQRFKKMILDDGFDK